MSTSAVYLRFYSIKFVVDWVLYYIHLPSYRSVAWSQFRIAWIQFLHWKTASLYISPTIIMRFTNRCPESSESGFCILSSFEKRVKVKNQYMVVVSVNWSPPRISTDDHFAFSIGWSSQEWRGCMKWQHRTGTPSKMSCGSEDKIDLRSRSGIIKPVHSCLLLWVYRRVFAS